MTLPRGGFSASLADCHFTHAREMKGASKVIGHFSARGRNMKSGISRSLA
jgi:hypothetical protein